MIFCSRAHTVWIWSISIACIVYTTIFFGFWISKFVHSDCSRLFGYLIKFGNNLDHSRCYRTSVGIPVYSKKLFIRCINFCFKSITWHQYFWGNCFCLPFHFVLIRPLPAKKTSESRDTIIASKRKFCTIFVSASIVEIISMSPPMKTFVRQGVICSAKI